MMCKKSLQIQAALVATLNTFLADVVIHFHLVRAHSNLLVSREYQKWKFSLKVP